MQALDRGTLIEDYGEGLINMVLAFGARYEHSACLLLPDYH